jgi:hypothetical protein
MVNVLFPVLTTIDMWFGSFTNEVVRLCIWAVLCGVTSLLSYAVISNQQKLNALRANIREIRKELMDLNSNNHQFLLLAGKNIVVSLKLLANALMPAIVSSLPTLVVIIWLGTFHTYTLPKLGANVQIIVDPAVQEISGTPEHLFSKNDGRFSMRILDESHGVDIAVSGRKVYSGDPTLPPTCSIGPKTWWNSIVRSEVGYLDPETTVKELRFGFPRKNYVRWLPEWLGTWEVPFFLSLFVVVLVGRVVFKLK